MKFSKIDLLTLLISLFLFSSCKNTNTLGLDVDAGSSIRGILLDTVTVNSATVVDTLPVTTYPSSTTSSSGLSRYPLGYITDPVFGTSASEVAMGVALPGGSYSFGKNAVIDSAVLVIPYSAVANGINQSFYGDTTATYNITVSQLQNDLTKATNFLSNNKYPAGDQLGTFSAKIKPNTKVKVISIVTGAADTAVTNPAQIRIKLSASQIQSKILSLDSATLSTTAKFSAAFKGLKAKATTTGAGGLMFFDFSTDNSNIEIYYKKQNATTTTAIDTVVAKFPIKTGTTPVAASISHGFSKTIKDALAATVPQQRTYVQAMNGLKTQISFPYLKNLKQSLGGSNIIISKAELVVDIENPADSIPFKLPLRLALYRNDIAGQRTQLADNDATDIRTATSKIPFGGFYDATKKSYTFVVTSYIQDVIAGKTIDYGTYLLPTSYTEFNVFPFASNASRGVIGSFSNGSNRKIRLNIYYVNATTAQ